MAGRQVGVVKACLRGPDGKSKYITVGRWIKDGDKNAVVLDSLPLPNANWGGWLNLFETAARTGHSHDLDDDDIPF